MEAQNGGCVRAWLGWRRQSVSCEGLDERHDQKSDFGCACIVPLRTKMTPDHRLGSPGVRLTKTPLGHACLRPALKASCRPMISEGLVDGQKEKRTRTRIRFGEAYNSASNCCRRRAGRLLIFAAAADEAMVCVCAEWTAGVCPAVLIFSVQTPACNDEVEV